jgi:hypothetical protein
MISYNNTKLIVRFEILRDQNASYSICYNARFGLFFFSNRPFEHYLGGTINDIFSFKKRRTA